MVHTRLMSTAGGGRGYVKHIMHSSELLVAQVTVLRPSFRRFSALTLGMQHVVDGQARDWRSVSWLMRARTAMSWRFQFLTMGDRGVYIYCDVEEHRAKLSVSARADSAGRVCEALGKATYCVHTLLM